NHPQRAEIPRRAQASARSCRSQGHGGTTPAAARWPAAGARARHAPARPLRASPCPRCRRHRPSTPQPPCTVDPCLASCPGVVMDETVMAGDLQSRGKGSAATVRRVGIVVGVLLMAGFATLLQQDRQARIDAAYRQSMALATGVDRLIHFAFRNLERALAGIAADAATWT